MNLREILGNDYLSLGFVFNRGGFRALDLTTPRVNFIFKEFQVPSFAGSYGATMARTGMPLFLLDLRRIPGHGPVNKWFADGHILKWIDSVYASEKDIKYLFHLPSIFDTVIFIEKTSGARPNQPRKRLKLFY
jgi:hypothetical protein